MLTVNLGPPLKYFKNFCRLFSRTALPSTSLLIILLGCLLRIIASVKSIALVHPDEHFQTLEPAAWLAYGIGWQSWEWGVGIRSWSLPGFYSGVMILLKAFGIGAGGTTPIIACRVVMACLSGAVLFQFRRLLQISGLSEVSIIVALLAFTFSPACVAWSPTTLSDNCAMTFLWLAMPALISALNHNNKRYWALAGFYLGLLTMIRIQMALWLVGAFIVAMAARSRTRLIISWVIGVLFSLLLQGVFDRVTWGGWFHTLRENVRINLLEGRANIYGVSPWYEYFSFVSTNLGPFLAAVILVSALLMLTKLCFSGWRKWHSKTYIFVLVPSTIFAAAHIVIPHKELRFLLPIYPAFFFILALGTESIGLSKLMEKAMESLRSSINPFFLGRRSFQALLTISLPAFFILSLREVESGRFVYPFDLADLALLMWRDGGSTRPPSCVLLIDHFKIWTHGELLQGHPVSDLRVESKQLPEFSIQARKCSYALIFGPSEALFKAWAGQNWIPVAHDRQGQSLYKNLRVVNRVITL